MKKILSIFIISLFVCSGCALFPKKAEKTAEELISDGMNYFEREKYRNAIESFQKLKDWYPFSKYAILAELKTADSHYILEEYEEASAGYEMFEKLHPRNEAIPEVLYKMGMCYFERMPTIDRDQTLTQEAFDIFNRLREQYHQSLYAGKAAEKIELCKKNLAEHEFRIGHFYYKSKHFGAALQRFDAASSSPDPEIRENAMKYMQICEKSLEQKPELEK